MSTENHQRLSLDRRASGTEWALPRSLLVWTCLYRRWRQGWTTETLQPQLRPAAGRVHAICVDSPFSQWKSFARAFLHSSTPITPSLQLLARIIVPAETAGMSLRTGLQAYASKCCLLLWPFVMSTRPALYHDLFRDLSISVCSRRIRRERRRKPRVI